MLGRGSRRTRMWLLNCGNLRFYTIAGRVRFHGLALAFRLALLTTEPRRTRSSTEDGNGSTQGYSGMPEGVENDHGNFLKEQRAPRRTLRGALSLPQLLLLLVQFLCASVVSQLQLPFSVELRVLRVSVVFS